jgi:hypothetical protein
VDYDVQYRQRRRLGGVLADVTAQKQRQDDNARTSKPPATPARQAPEGWLRTGSYESELANGRFTSDGL